MRLATVLALLGVFTTGAGAETLWRLSDALGTDHGAAPQSSPGKGWVLRVETRAGGEDRTLFENGLEDSTRFLDFDASGRTIHWRDVRAGQPVWEVSVDPSTELPVSETTFSNGTPAEVSTLLFNGRQLVRRTVRGPDASLLYEDRLYYWPDGSLRRLERDGPDGPMAEAAWSYGPEHRLQGAWLADAENKVQGEHRAWTFAAGRTEEVLAGTEAISSRVTEALEAGRTRETRNVFAAGYQEIKLTDDKGRTSQETISVKGIVQQTKTWKYDDKGRPAELTTESAGPLEVWVYRYPDDLTEATLTRDGVVVRIETSRDGEKQAVQLFDRGQLFLVETWEKGKRVKETYYDHGQIVRERRP